MHDDVFELDSAESIIQGLVQTGWVGFQEEGQPFSAERNIVNGDGFQISFIVVEYPTSLNFIVELNVFTPKDVEDERVFCLGGMITRLFLQHSMAIGLASVGGDARTHRFRFVYPWKCDDALKLTLTIPTLCETIERWSDEIPLPIMSLAPLARWFLVGTMKEEEEFLKQAGASLDFVECRSLGRA